MRKLDRCDIVIAEYRVATITARDYMLCAGLGLIAALAINLYLLIAACRAAAFTVAMLMR